ncbi:MAG TPA: hypothetical protein VMR21_03435 [Vicinamibacteria bacterium]|nr:hypothetical protein [Vicinamibacteria bacterium]
MREYSPRRRTAVVLAGSGTSGAYHAGVLKALDESGVKLDLIVGSGVGTVGAAFAAAAGGGRLYGERGFWADVSWDAFFRLRPAVRITILLLACSFGVFLLPVFLALAAGLLFPLVLIVDMVAPGRAGQATSALLVTPSLLRAPYLAALALPIFFLCAAGLGALVRLWLTRRRRMSESLEWLLDAGPGRRRLLEALWEIARGAALASRVPSEAEVGRKYVALVSENLGQPGFRELILRTADLETGGPLPFVVLGDVHRAAFAAARTRGPRSRLEGLPGAIDLRSPGYEGLLFDAVMTGLVAPGVTPVRRVAFPKGGLFGGESHRLTESGLAGGSGLSEAIAAGAEQVLVVSATPSEPAALPRRRGPRALVDGVLAALERQAVEGDLKGTERINRMVETLGHRTDDGGRGWQDPATGRVYRSVALYVIRPDRRVLAPLDLDGSEDPATEVRATTDDLVELGYRDAYRLFVEPVVGAVPEVRPAAPAPDRPQAVEL